jgi:hypothetical protein
VKLVQVAALHRCYGASELPSALYMALVRGLAVAAWAGRAALVFVERLPLSK